MSAVQLLAGELTVVLAFGVAAAVLVAITTLAAALFVDVTGDGGDVRGDVQRFVELSAAAHASLPDGPLLSDPQGRASAAIGRLLAKKDEARAALWASSDAIRPAPQAARALRPAPATVSRLRSPGAGLVPAGAWRVDPACSSVGFAVRQLLVGRVEGRFRRLSGTLEVGERGAEAAGAIRAGSIDTGKPRRDAHLRSADFLDVETYPEIAFVSTSIERTGPGSFRVAGDLTVHGITRPVELAGSLAADGGDRMALELRGRLDRRAFGLTWGGLLVGNRVGVELELSLLRTAASAAA